MTSRPKLVATSRLLLGILCIALVLFGATLQAVHSHTDNSLRHADCSLCAAAHVVSHVVASPTPNQIAFVITAVVLAPPLASMGAIYHFALFTRPPPSSMHLA